MAVADKHGLPVAVSIASASPHEVTLVGQTLAEMMVSDAPEHLVGDNAYDSDKLDAELAPCGVEMIAPHRSNRKNTTQDGRALRRYRRRWKVERLFAWLHNFRRLIVRSNTDRKTSLAWFIWRSSLSSFVGYYEMTSSRIAEIRS